jgi:hypothetical protein
MIPIRYLLYIYLVRDDILCVLIRLVSHKVPLIQLCDIVEFRLTNKEEIRAIYGKCH